MAEHLCDDSGHVYREPARDVPVLGEWDVVVCGGGPAGCAAAVAAGRAGARTLLVERHGHLGGAPVTQNVVPILSTNGVDFQGVWHEWARELQRLGGVTDLLRQEYPHTTWLVGSVDPMAVPYAWDALTSGAGVDALHLVRCAGAIVIDGAIRGVLVETKAGRRALLARRVVDATGDADVAAAAGAGFDCGVDARPWAMGVSLNAWYGGVPTGDNYTPGLTNPPLTGRSLGPTPLFQAGLLRMLRVNPLCPWDLTRAMQEGREEIRRRLEVRQQRDGCEGLFLAGIADEPGVRSSRRVHGVATATADDAWELKTHADGIARCSWEIDIHPAESAEGKGVEFDADDYRPRVRRVEAGECFDVRYGCLISRDVENLLTAGRCISAEHEAQACLRIQQTCMATGQAAGLAAAMSIADDVPPASLDTAALVDRLAEARDVEPAFEILRGSS